MKVTLNDRELSEALSRLSRVEAERAVTVAAFDMAKRAKRYTPQGETRGLVNSIRTEVHGATGVVGYEAEYAPHVEFGHRQNVGQYVEALGKRLVKPYVQGQHFLRRAFTETKAKLGDELKRMLEEAER